MYWHVSIPCVWNARTYVQRQWRRQLTCAEWGEISQNESTPRPVSESIFALTCADENHMVFACIQLNEEHTSLAKPPSYASHFHLLSAYIRCTHWQPFVESEHACQRNCRVWERSNTTTTSLMTSHCRCHTTRHTTLLLLLLLRRTHTEHNECVLTESWIRV